MISTDTPEFKCDMDRTQKMDGTADKDILFDTRRTAQNGIYTLFLENLADTIASGLVVSVLTAYVKPSVAGFVDGTDTANWITDAASELFLDTSLDISTVGDTADYSITQAYVNNNTTTTIIHQTGDGVVVRLTGGGAGAGTIAVKLRIR